MHLEIYKLLLFLLFLDSITSTPQSRYTDELEAEERRRKKKKPRPCRPRSTPDGKTFFDLTLAYIDVENTYVCGGGGGGNYQNDFGNHHNRPLFGNHHGGHGSHGNHNQGSQGSHNPGNPSNGNGGLESGLGGDYGNPQESHFGNRPQGGLFGNRPGGLFGNRPEGGLFGNRPEGGIFGNRPLAGLLANRPQGGLFGNRPEGGLFGNRPEGGLFGNRPQGLLGNRPGGGLFGNRPGGGLFGNRPGGGLFGNRPNRPGSQNEEEEPSDIPDNKPTEESGYADSKPSAENPDDSGNPNNPVNPNNPGNLNNPSYPGNPGHSHQTSGYFFGLFDGSILNGFFGTNNKPPRPYPPQQAEKPVHEIYDEVFPDDFQNYKPGQYVVAYNPLLGSYTEDVSDYNPKKVLRKINKQFEKNVVDPLVDLFF